jgi:hypothetical protein
VLGGFRCFRLTRRLFLLFVGLVGVLLLILVELFQGLLGAGIIRPQNSDQPLTQFQIVILQFVGLVILPLVVGVRLFDNGLGVRAMGKDRDNRQKNGQQRGHDSHALADGVVLVSLFVMNFQFSHSYFVAGTASSASSSPFSKCRTLVAN